MGCETYWNLAGYRSPSINLRFVQIQIGMNKNESKNNFNKQLSSKYIKTWHNFSKEMPIKSVVRSFAFWTNEWFYELKCAAFFHSLESNPFGSTVLADNLDEDILANVFSWKGRDKFVFMPAFDPTSDGNIRLKTGKYNRRPRTSFVQRDGMLKILTVRCD